MRKLIIALTAIAALAAPAVAGSRRPAASGDAGRAPRHLGEEYEAHNRLGRGRQGHLVNPFSITRKTTKRPPIFFAQ